jgi:predicted molibdopterin-dependent oxidoreductase YjgC
LVRLTAQTFSSGILATGSRAGFVRTLVRAKARLTEKSSPGVVFMTFHFAETPTNVLTNPALDPVAKIPELKVCAVSLTKAVGD